MARNHARIHVTIWQDPDFLTLGSRPQRLYLFLLSQPNLTHLGVLPLTLRRWAQSCVDYNLDRLRADLTELERARFVVVDDDAEELLVRSLLRGDGVYKQPNVLRGAIATAPAVQSVRIKRCLLAEIERIDLADVTEDKGRREDARTLLGTLREALAVPVEQGSENPSGTHQVTPGEGFTEPQEEPLTEGFREPPTHARAQPLVLAPAPTPSSLQSPTGRANAPSADSVVAAYIEGATTSGKPRPSGKLIGRVGRDAKRLLGEGVPVDELVRAATSCGQRGWDDLDRERQQPNRGRPVSSGQVSATDAEYEDLSGIWPDGRPA